MGGMGGTGCMGGMGGMSGMDMGGLLCTDDGLSRAFSSAGSDSVAGRSGLHFTALLKNVMSIMTEEREQILFSELEVVDWDIVLLNETWRPSKEEIWTTSRHLFLASGGTRGSNGVAVLLHRRWVKGFRAFHAISERLCALDVDIQKKRFRFIVVYMPTSWHQD